MDPFTRRHLLRTTSLGGLAPAGTSALPMAACAEDPSLRARFHMCSTPSSSANLPGEHARPSDQQHFFSAVGADRPQRALRRSVTPTYQNQPLDSGNDAVFPAHQPQWDETSRVERKGLRP